MIEPTPATTTRIVRQRVGNAVLDLVPQGDLYLIIPPRFGEPWPAMGGTFAGGMLSPDDDRTHDYWLVVGNCSRVLPWHAAMTWATDLRVGELRGWSLPSRAEMGVMHANIRHLLKPAPHWTCARLAWDSTEAYAFSFEDGFCSWQYNTSDGLIARAVRRIPMRIEQ